MCVCMCVCVRVCVRVGVCERVNKCVSQGSGPQPHRTALPVVLPVYRQVCVCVCTRMCVRASVCKSVCTHAGCSVLQQACASLCKAGALALLGLAKTIHIYICIYSVYTIFLAGKSSNTRSCTVYINIRF